MKRLGCVILASALGVAGCDDDKSDASKRAEAKASARASAASSAPAASAVVIARKIAQPEPVGTNGAPQPSPSTSGAPAPSASIGTVAPVDAGGGMSEGPAILVRLMQWIPVPPDPKGVTLELKGDGTILIGGKLVGRIAGARFEDPKGNVQGYVDKDGVVRSLDPKDTDKARFGAKDEYMVTSGASDVRIVIADDGSVTVSRNGKSERAPFRIQGFKKEARRAAGLLSYAMLMQMVEPRRPNR